MWNLQKRWRNCSNEACVGQLGLCTLLLEMPGTGLGGGLHIVSPHPISEKGRTKRGNSYRENLDNLA